jgi:hypothetical protein
MIGHNLMIGLRDECWDNLVCTMSMLFLQIFNSTLA